MSSFSRPSIEQPKFVGDAQQVSLQLKHNTKPASKGCSSCFKVGESVLTIHSTSAAAAEATFQQATRFNLCPYCGESLPGDHGAKMEVFKEKGAKRYRGISQTEPGDIASLPVSDSKRSNLALLLRPPIQGPSLIPSLLICPTKRRLQGACHPVATKKRKLKLFCR